MIFPDGYMEFRQAFWLWADHYLEHRNLLDSAGIIRDEAHSEANTALKNGMDLFCDDLVKEIPVYLQTLEGPLHRVTGKICEYATDAMLSSASPTCDRDFEREFERDAEEHHGPEENTLASEFYSLPSIGDARFLYINPSLSVVDCSGADLICRYLHEDYDAREHARLERLAESIAGLETIMVEMGESNFHELLGYRDLMDFESVLIGAQDHYRRLEGHSICINKDLLAVALETLYPLDKDTLVQTVAAETRATQAFLEYMKAHPHDKPTRGFVEGNVVGPLGTRAMNRVWNRVAEDYPRLKLPGRPKKSPH